MPFTSIQKIRFDDVDGAGIVYYPTLFHYCHVAFEQAWGDAQRRPVRWPLSVRAFRV